MNKYGSIGFWSMFMNYLSYAYTKNFPSSLCTNFLSLKASIKAIKVTSIIVPLWLAWHLGHCRPCQTTFAKCHAHGFTLFKACTSPKLLFMCHCIVASGLTLEVHKIDIQIDVFQTHYIVSFKMCNI